MTGLINPKTILDGVDDKYVPDGYETAEDFLTYARKEFYQDANFDKENRLMAIEDLKFAAGDQWDPIVRAEREELGRPCMTINVIPTFVGQIIGDRRLNETSIVVKPFQSGTKEIADVRTGLIKSIEAYSRADRVYDLACEDQVICGISNIRVDLEYAGNDVFDQDIFIRHIPNPLAVIWDRMACDPTGRDARRCFVNDTMPRDVYNKQWPKCPAPTSLQDINDADITFQGWYDKDVVRVTEFWELIDKPATFALLQDGKTVDITNGWEFPGQEKLVYVDQTTGKPKIRKSFRTYARMHLITGFAILTEAYEVPVTRLPIIRVEGRVIRVGEDRMRFGLVRFMKDSQRLKNYWRSTCAETLALAPKAQWIAPSDAIEGREDDWRDAHRSGDPLLIFNKNASSPPIRVDPPQFPAALAQEAQMNHQDIMDTTGLQQAALGMQGNEVSGIAINSRKKEGDVATVMYSDNLGYSIQEVGDVTNQFIPIAYDTVRMVRTIGFDNQQELLAINDPNDPNSIDITFGKYDVAVKSGPSFTTQREEAANSMMAIVQTSPEIMAVAGDIIVEAMDWSQSQRIASRLFKTIPAQLTSGEDDPGTGQPVQPPPPPDPNSPQGQAAAQQQQLAQAAFQNQMGELEHSQNIRQYKEATALADAQKASAQAAAAHAGVGESQANAMRAQAEAVHAHTRNQLQVPEALQKMHQSEQKHELSFAQAADQHHKANDLHNLAVTAKAQTVDHAERKQRGAEHQQAHGMGMAQDSANVNNAQKKQQMGLAERAASAIPSGQQRSSNQPGKGKPKGATRPTNKKGK